MNVSSTNISWFEVANFGDLFIYINSYKIYLNGLIEQWGLIHTSSGGDTSVFLNIEYTKIYQTFATILGSFGANGETVICFSKTLSTINFRCYSTNRDIMWSAIGD